MIMKLDKEYQMDTEEGKGLKKFIYWLEVSYYTNEFRVHNN